MSPEARAAAVVRDYYATDLDVINGAEGEKRTIEALIAKAIREAENAALERAKVVAQNEADFAARNQRPGGGPSEGTISATAIVLEIERLQSDRSLKHKD